MLDTSHYLIRRLKQLSTRYSIGYSHRTIELPSILGGDNVDGCVLDDEAKTSCSTDSFIVSLLDQFLALVSRHFHSNVLILLSLLFFQTCSTAYEKTPETVAEEVEAGYFLMPEIRTVGQPKIREIKQNTLKKVPATGKDLVQVKTQVVLEDKHMNRVLPPVRLANNKGIPFSPNEKTKATPPNSIPAKGQELKIKNPGLLSALPPDFRDDARFNIQVLEVKQGLSSSSCISILEDRRGYLWLGSPTGGLTRYDGHYFAHFTTRQGLSSDQVFSLLEDRQGNLWMGMGNYGGIIRYDGQTFTHFGIEQGIPSRVIYDIMEDQQGNLWFGTELEGAIRYDGDNFTFFSTDDGLISNTIYSMKEDRSGNLWFGSVAAGVTMFNGQSYTRYPQIGDSIDVVTSIVEANDGDIWFGTVRSGVYQYDGTEFWQYTTAQGLSNNTILDIVEDDQSNLWFATRGNGASRYDGEYFTHFGSEEGMSNNTILTLGKDRWNNIWFGTEGGGICKFTPNSFEHITEKQGLAHNSIRTIMEDRTGSLWLGTQRSDISRYDSGEFTHFKLEEIGSSWIISNLEDQNGKLWFGTFGGGVIRYEPATRRFTQFNESQGLSKKNVEQLVEDQHGNLWIGTFEGGLNKFDGTDFTWYGEEDGLPGNSVISLLEDSKGDLWIGTLRNGVARYDGEKFVTYTTEEGLTHNGIRVIFEDSRGRIWFGTEGGGLNCLDGEYFFCYQLKEGVGDNYIQSIQEDRQGNFWFATMDGLYYASFDEDSGSISDSSQIASRGRLKIVEYSQTDGLKSEAFLANSSYLDRSNRLSLGTEKGLSMLNLENHQIVARPPFVFLSQLELNQTVVDFSDSEVLESLALPKVDTKPFSNFPVKLNLPYEINSPTFRYSASDGLHSDKASFQYRLDGYDDYWSQPTSETYVEYRNLPAGKYNFEIRAINDSGIWSEPASYAFGVRPPWWLSWWAKVLYGFSLLVGFLVVRWLYLRRRREKQAEEVERARLEEKSKQAEKIAAQAQQLEQSLLEVQQKNVELTTARDQLIVQEKLASLGNLTAGIAHEIKNPLNFIINFAEDSSSLSEELIELIPKDAEPQKREEWLQTIEDIKLNTSVIGKNGYKIDRIVRSMMDHARGEESSWQLIDLNLLLDENIELAHYSYRAGKSDINVDIQKDYANPLPKVKIHGLQIGRALLNIITNAFHAVNEQKQKDSNYQPVIAFSTREKNGAIEIRIRDNGPGIPREIQKEIFTPFFTTKAVGQGNTGLGLSISYDVIVKEHQGSLELHSEEGKFTEFKIILPQNPDFEKEEE